MRLLGEALLESDAVRLYPTRVVDPERAGVGCQARRHGVPGGAGPEGYAGTVTYTAGGQTRDLVAWFACRRTHIGPAVRAALDAAGELS